MVGLAIEASVPLENVILRFIQRLPDEKSANCTKRPVSA